MKLTRPLTALAAAAVGALALSLAGPAQAATGTLILNAQEIRNPSGCYNASSFPLRIINRTNDVVLVFDQPRCAGHRIAVVAPGQTSVDEFGASVYIR
ncbi:hypothetical protein ABZ595_29145 [Streptomyces rubradiris]|uniref:hypothetical protein n=1 Tax=Streptomyces rubradiris TaxID=285531 RepID=UPI0033EEC5A1